MKLYKFYNNGEKLVFGTFAEGKTRFFFSGFASAEDAKKETLAAHLEHKKKSRPKAPIGLLMEELEMVLSGKWSEIE